MNDANSVDAVMMRGSSECSAEHNRRRARRAQKRLAPVAARAPLGEPPVTTHASPQRHQNARVSAPPSKRMRARKRPVRWASIRHQASMQSMQASGRASGVGHASSTFIDKCTHGKCIKGRSNSHAF